VIRDSFVHKHSPSLAAAGAVLALLTAGCAAPPAALRLAPQDDAVSRRVFERAKGVACRWGLFALHLESGRRLEWNADEAFEAASVIKLALLAEAAARISEGTLDPARRWTLTEPSKAVPSSLLLEFDSGLQPTERDLLFLMIGRSDNTAANHFFDLLGKDAVNARMERLGLNDIRLLGRIPDRDPEATQAERWKGLALGSMTPRATGEYYRRAAGGELLGGTADRLIWDVLSSQHQLDRIPRLAGEETGSRWAGKTGTKRAVRNDSGILTTRKGRFVLVMFADRIAEKEGETIRATQAMGEMAKAIVDGWSRTLPDVQGAKP
jgi:beta-lactamase class A